MRFNPTIHLLLCIVVLAGCASDPDRGNSTAESAPPATQATPTYDIGKVSQRPNLLRQAPPVYPLALRKAGKEGYAVIDFIVGTDGAVHRAFAIKSSNPLFAETSVAAVTKWRFSPGYINGRAVNTHLQVPIEFSLTDAERAALRTNKRLPTDAIVYTAAEGVRPPHPLRQPPPEYPLELRKRGVVGSATVEFVVTTDGTVANAEATETTRPEFGAAAVTAVEHWVFNPALRDGKPVNYRMHMPIVFSLNDE